MGIESGSRTACVTFCINLILKPSEWPREKGEDNPCYAKPERVSGFEFKGDVTYDDRCLLSKRANTIPLVVFQMPWQDYLNGIEEYWGLENEIGIEASNKWLNANFRGRILNETYLICPGCSLTKTAVKQKVQGRTRAQIIACERCESTM